MSMKSWTEEGYGYKLFNNYNMDNIKKFLIDNDCYEDDLIEQILEAEDEYELSDVLGEPVAWVIAGIINEEEGFDFNIFKGYYSCADTDQEAMLGIQPIYPWETGKLITVNERNRLLEKYAQILGIRDLPDYFIAEYYG